jgi:hypothetical protein
MNRIAWWRLACLHLFPEPGELNRAERNSADEGGNLRVRQVRRVGRTQGLLLALFGQSLGIGLAVWIEQVLAALLPRGFKFGRGDVPVRSAFPADGTQVLAELFDRGSSEKPVAAVDLVNDKAGLQHDHVRDHGIVAGQAYAYTLAIKSCARPPCCKPLTRWAIQPSAESDHIKV